MFDGRRSNKFFLYRRSDCSRRFSFSCFTKKNHLYRVNRLVGYTPLCLAAQYGSLPYVQLLLQNGANNNKPTSKGSTPLYLAACARNSYITTGAPSSDEVVHTTRRARRDRELSEQNYIKIVQLLLQSGANKARTPNGDPRSALSQAKKHNFEAVVKLLRNDLCGETQLCQAVCTGDESKVKTLLESAGESSNIERLTSNGETPLCIAAAEGHNGIAKLLLEYGADVNRPSVDGETPLYMASRAGHYGVVATLLSAGANVDQSDLSCHSKLHGRELQEAYLDGQTPLFIAVERGSDPKICSENHKKIIEFLLHDGADVNHSCYRGILRKGETPLDVAINYASEKEDLSIVELLLSKRGNINKPDSSGRTVLHNVSAVWNLDSPKLASLLLSMPDANIKATDQKGRTPLHAAVSKKNFIMVELLLKAAEERGLTRYKNMCDNTKNSRTPLGVAREKEKLEEGKYTEMIKFLEEKGCLG